MTPHQYKIRYIASQMFPTKYVVWSMRLSNFHFRYVLQCPPDHHLAAEYHSEAVTHFGNKYSVHFSNEDDDHTSYSNERSTFKVGAYDFIKI